MVGDKSLYPEIGQWIFNSSPDEAEKLVMRASLSDEGDVGTFEFDYIKMGGITNWFDAGAKATTELTKLLNILRKSYIDEGQPSWNKYEFILDVKTGRFEFNIDYEDSEQ